MHSILSFPVDTIFEIKANFTTVIISHKKNLIERCDKIYQIDCGKVNLVSKFNN